MKNLLIIFAIGIVSMTGYSQTEVDSSSVTMSKADSIKLEKKAKRDAMVAKIKAKAIFPVLEAGTYSGVIPVDDVTEIPDKDLDYKLLFEIVNNQTDSISGLNSSLVEVARVINLHVASGIPTEKIFPVIVVHAGALNSFTTNEFYNQKFKKDNPNLKLIKDLEGLGAKYIACGQAMFFFNVNKEALLPMFKVSLTAQTVLSSYQLKGYVKYRMR